MVQILIFIAVIAIVVLLYFKNKVDRRKIDLINRLAEKQEELIEILKEKNNKENES